MNILYVTRTVTGDEEAITNGFKLHGHEVEMINVSILNAKYGKYSHFDFMLYHQWTRLDQIPLMPLLKVLWCFDLITHPTYLPDELKVRKEWMRRAMNCTDLGFCTDGGYCNIDDRMIRLVQGAQKAYWGEPQEKQYDIVFAGSTLSPWRITFLDKLELEFPGKLERITSRKQWVYGQDFANLIASTKIMIAPDYPISNSYWSNRVYTILGYGGFLLHPYIEELSHQYEDGKEIVYYHSLEDLYDKIRYYLDNEEERKSISSAGLERTAKEHMYHHRCETLIEHVEELIGANT